jgi:glycosyltransferase involved in cell wall biosynthesis
MDELISDGIDGILFKANDAKSLAKAINKICADPSLAKEMGEKGYNKYKIKFYPADKEIESAWKREWVRCSKIVGLGTT